MYRGDEVDGPDGSVVDSWDPDRSICLLRGGIFGELYLLGQSDFTVVLIHLHGGLRGKLQVLHVQVACGGRNKDLTICCEGEVGNMPVKDSDIELR